MREEQQSDNLQDLVALLDDPSRLGEADEIIRNQSPSLEERIRQVLSQPGVLEILQKMVDQTKITKSIPSSSSPDSGE
ncbi:MAG: hypothetical protein ACN6QE_16320 [Pseudomonas putida]